MLVTRVHTTSLLPLLRHCSVKHKFSIFPGFFFLCVNKTLFVAGMKRSKLPQASSFKLNKSCFVFIVRKWCGVGPCSAKHIVLRISIWKIKTLFISADHSVISTNVPLAGAVVSWHGKSEIPGKRLLLVRATMIKYVKLYIVKWRAEWEWQSLSPLRWEGPW